MIWIGTTFLAIYISGLIHQKPKKTYKEIWSRILEVQLEGNIRDVCIKIYFVQLFIIYF